MRLRSRYDDHGTSLNWKSDWDLAKLVLPLIIPNELPLFDSKEKVLADLLEVLTRLFQFVVDAAAPEAEDIFEKFNLNLPKIYLKEIFDGDGLTLGYSEEFELENKSPLFDCKKFNSSVENVLSANCLYLMGHGFYRNDSLDEAAKALKKCLIVGTEFLNNEIKASAWYMLACSSLNKTSKVCFFFF